MSLSLTPPDGSPRCPSCLALTPVDGLGRLPGFCSLCHAPLAPPVDVPVDVSVDPTPIAEPPEFDEQAVSRMLIELQASDPDPWVVRGSRVSTRTGKVLLSLGVAVAVLVVVLAVAAVVGLLVEGR